MKLIAEIIGSRVTGYSPPNLFVDPSFTLLFIFTIFWKCFHSSHVSFLYYIKIKMTSIL